MVDLPTVRTTSVFGFRVITEQRVRVQNTVGEKWYRVPGVCVVRTPFEHEEVFTRAPYVAIEVLSADDRVADTLLKTSDYSRFGIQHIWIVDPEALKLFSAVSHGIGEVEDLVGQLPEINPSVDFNPKTAVDRPSKEELP